MLTVVRFLQLSFISGRKLDAVYGYILSFETENWICWYLVVETLHKLYLETKFNWPTDF